MTLSSLPTNIILIFGRRWKITSPTFGIFTFASKISEKFSTCFPSWGALLSKEVVTVSVLAKKIDWWLVSQFCTESTSRNPTSHDIDNVFLECTFCTSRHQTTFSNYSYFLQQLWNVELVGVAADVSNFPWNGVTMCVNSVNTEASYLPVCECWFCYKVHKLWQVPATEWECVLRRAALSWWDVIYWVWLSYVRVANKLLAFIDKLNTDTANVLSQKPWV